MSSPSINTLTSFSGADLVVSFANQVIGELQAISWAIQREKSPVFTLGSADSRSTSRGKRGIAGTMSFAVFDQDSLLEAMKRIWDKVAPPAMFTPAGNLALQGTENFLNAIDMTNWNMTAQEAISTGIIGPDGSKINATHEGNFGYIGTSAIKATGFPGSNNKPIFGNSDNGSVEIVDWEQSTDEINVPAGFTPIRGGNILYADMLPPFDVTLTFGNEYGQCAFQKIYDIDILNESSGVSVDTTVLERQLTYIARRLSPLISGVYSREEGGNIKGLPVKVRK